ncbi:MAG TPA: hypothetical protein VK138_14550 [Acidiferrobacterales bacterium]|nr:hypothetical protein [Acidiferrobacterales bacterium]
MKPQEIERWKKIRDKGMPRFILLTGILSYGVPMFVALNFIIPPKNPLSITDIVVTLLICAVAGGGVFGYIVWLVQEKRYRKVLDKAN